MFLFSLHDGSAGDRVILAERMFVVPSLAQIAQSFHVDHEGAVAQAVVPLSAGLESVDEGFSQNAASSFSLASGRNGNTNPQDLVTDGTSIWVVDGSALKVFKYTLSGSSLGSWSIDPANKHPTGITIDPSNVSDIWIVDNGTDKVYQYTAAASRTSGSQNAAATFALNPYDTNPQGVADPPPPSMLISQTPVTVSLAVQPETALPQLRCTARRE